jgi:DNA-binding IclR family transcriptional regulator
MVYATLQHKTARRVLRTLTATERGLTNGELSNTNHLPRSTISECVSLLIETRLVRRSFTLDGQILYEIEDNEQVVRLLAAFEKNLLSIASDRFIELWDL